MQLSESESDVSIGVENNMVLDNPQAWDVNEDRGAAIHIEDGNEFFTHEEGMTLEQRVKNHAVAAAIFTGAFVLPCFIAAKLLK